MADKTESLPPDERREARRKSLVSGKASSFEELKAKTSSFGATAAGA